MLTIYKTASDRLQMLTLATMEKGSWFNLINPTADELYDVMAATGAPMDFLKAALDEEERSRTEIEENAVLIITNIPIMRATDTYDTLPLGIIITPDHFVTVCLEPNEVLSDFRNETSKAFSTVKKTRFLFQLLYKSATLYLRYLRQITRRSDEIELLLRKSTKNQEIFQLMELQKGLTFFMAALRSNGIVMEKLLRMRTNSHLQHLISVYEEDEDLLEDVIIENQQAIQMVEMYSNILNSMMDTFSSTINNNLNRVMKFLASMTILLSIPTMLSSFMGMNVDVPWRDGEGGFIYVALIAIVSTCITAFALWKKDFF